MKISELNTKAFLGAQGAAANSYVLINYEDNTTQTPVTYKASLQELGKAIANDLKLPTVTVSQGEIVNFKVKGVTNGAYVDNTISGEFASENYVDTAINQITSCQGTADADGTLLYLVKSSIVEPYITDKYDTILYPGLMASHNYVTNLTNALASRITDLENGTTNGTPSIDVSMGQNGTYSYEIPDYDNEDLFDPTTMSPSGAMLVFTTAESEPIQERPLLIWDAANHKAVPYNLATPFYIEENSSLISRGQNVFVDADSSSYDKLYVMTSTGPSEISIGGAGGSSEPIIETMQTTLNAVQNQGGAQEAAIVFTPVDMSGFFNGLYGCTENGNYDLLNLGTNLLYTSVEEQNTYYYPLWTDGQGNLYYYNSGSWSQVTP